MAEERLTSQLMASKKTFITLDEIQNLVPCDEYMELWELVNKLIRAEIIKPVGKKNGNGLIPPLHLKYRICRLPEDQSCYFEEIRHLYPELKISEYLANPALYKNHRDVLLPLSEFLKDRSESLIMEMSKNERAYEIWQYEKMLDRPLTRSVLKFVEMENKLNYYLTPEPFFDFVLNNREEMTVLILENKDTWFTFRKLLARYPENCYLFGEKIDAVVYGEGNKVTKSDGLTLYAEKVLCAKVRFLYFGDLDYTGVDLFLRVCRANPGIGIKLFTALYLKMLQLTRTENLGQIQTNQNQNIPLEEFLSYFPAEQADQIREIFGRCKYIPQEVINHSILKELLTSAET